MDTWTECFSELDSPYKDYLYNGYKNSEKNTIVLELAVPGFTKDDISVTYHPQTQKKDSKETISSAVIQTKEHIPKKVPREYLSDEGTIGMTNFKIGKFMHTIFFPMYMVIDSVTVNNGLLVMILRSKNLEEITPQVIQIA